MTEAGILWLTLVSFTVLVAGGVFVVISGMRHRARILEMMHRERLALIERGLVPPPERDPEAFERGWPQRAPTPSAAKAQAAGVVLISLGAGLALLLGLTAGVPEVGLGLGGAIAAIGTGIVINARLASGPPVPEFPPRADSVARGDRQEPPSSAV